MVNVVLCPHCQAYLGLQGKKLSHCPRCKASVGNATAKAAPREPARETTPRHRTEHLNYSEDEIAIGKVIVILVCIFLLGASFLANAVINAPINLIIIRSLWRGSAFARWLVCVGLAIGFVVVLVALDVQHTRITLLDAILLGIPSLFGLAVASPWVTAFQASQRAKQLLWEEEQKAKAERTSANDRHIARVILFLAAFCTLIGGVYGYYRGGIPDLTLHSVLGLLLGLMLGLVYGLFMSAFYE
jgi:uncharacterized membrane protein